MLTGSKLRRLRYIVVASIVIAAFCFFSKSGQPAISLTNNAPDSKGAGSRLNGHDVDVAQKPLPVEHHGPSANSQDSASEKAAVTPSTQQSTAAPGPRVNATFITLARNVDIWDIARSIRQVEDRFNHRFHYDWVFLNDKLFDETFRNITTALVSGTTYYGQIPEAHWSVPDWIDADKAKQARIDMEDRNILYGGSVSYRHMCRFESGFFALHPLMQNYELYWRVEPGIELFCDTPQDPFRFIKESGKKYGFVISLLELADTIPTLWDSAKKFMQNFPQHIATDNLKAFLSDDGGETYNMCHFWSNFEIGNLDWMRGQAYMDFFNSLDQDGGFFYERWGDAPIHSIAAGLLLNKTDIHFFDNIGYFHMPFTHCPNDAQARLDLKCHCNPKDNFDWSRFSCTSKFFDVSGFAKPAGYDD